MDDNVLQPFFRRTLDLYWRKLMEAGPTTTRGDILDMTWVKEKSGIDDPWRLHDRLIRWYLKEHGIRTRKRGNGLYLEYEGEQVHSSARELFGRIISAAKNAAKRLGAVDPLKLDEPGKLVREVGLDRAGRHLMEAREARQQKVFSPAAKRLRD